MKSNKYTPSIQEMLQESTDILYDAQKLQSKMKKYIKKLNQYQNRGKGITRSVARKQYNGLVHGGSMTIDKLIRELNTSIDGLEGTYNDKLQRTVRRAAMIRLAKAVTK